MANVQLQTEVSIESLLQGVQNLDLDTLEQLVDKVLLLRAERRAQSLSVDEVLLLKQINAQLPEATQVRFAKLKSRRQTEELTSAEYEELLELVDQIEQRDLERLQALTTLAQLRNVTVRTLMQQLDLERSQDG